MTVKEVLAKLDENPTMWAGRRIVMAKRQGEWWNNLDRTVVSLNITPKRLTFTLA